MRAGLVFVVAALLVGGGFREWRRSHEERFQDIVAEIEGREAGRLDRESRNPETAPGSGFAGAVAESSRSALRRETSLGAAAPGLLAGMVDPDRASAAQLTRLPGIGPALAARIVADRDSRGPFGTPEALLRVSGIGPRTLARIRSYLVFGAPAEREPTSRF